MKGTKNPINFFKSWNYRIKHKKRTFPYYGIWAYMGEYGSGKTLSAVNKITDILLKYPKSRFISNTRIAGIANKSYYYETAEQLVKLINEHIKDGDNEGWVIFMDEIHVVLSELFGMADPTFLMYLSQLRKFGIIIIGTSQMYNKCPKLIRDYLRQGGQIIYCKKIFGGITLNNYVEMDTCTEGTNLKLECKISRSEWFFHTPQLYESYDTYAIVTQIKKLMNNSKGVKLNGN